jgi:uncharacterized protein YjbI with pentapeptide repeats
MSDIYKVEQTITQQDYSSHPLPKGTYELCVFSQCNLNNSDLSEYTFIECTFDQCDLSLADLSGTAFRDTEFRDSKMLGLHFEDCNPFLLSMRFHTCQLNLSTFIQVKLKKSAFKDCSLQEADFTEADMSGSVFAGCDLGGAVFERTILENCDLRTAYNYSIDPQENRLKKAKFSGQGLAGLLSKYDLDIE